LFEGWHFILSYLLAALIAVHVAAALRHHFLKRNDLLRRMWFGRAGAEARIERAAAKKGLT
jgi:cytochrome b561